MGAYIGARHALEVPQTYRGVERSADKCAGAEGAEGRDGGGVSLQEALLA